MSAETITGFLARGGVIHRCPVAVADGAAVPGLRLPAEAIAALDRYRLAREDTTLRSVVARFYRWRNGSHDKA
jgi:hypothetical protein